MQRPTGVTIIAVLAAIAGVFGLLAGIALLAAGPAVSSSTGLGGLVTVAALIVLAYSILSLALAYGFWTLKSWAWPLGVGVEVLGVVQAILQYMNDTRQVVSLVISIAIAGVVLWYLYQPHVKAAFGRA
jgi:low temperature requirement protein LtrA